jgi:uncharacterized protein (DUF433 family)
MGRDRDIYGGKDPREIPVYSIPEVAGYLNLPEATVRSWVAGRKYQTADGTRTFKPVIRAADPRTKTLSFQNLTEIHVLSVLRSDRVRLKDIRRAIADLRLHYGTDHPLADLDVQTDGVEVFVEQFGMLISASRYGQRSIKEVVEMYLKRIDRDKAKAAVCLYPFTRPQIETSPRLIAIDPQRRFGRPFLVERGIETWVVASRHQAGDSMEELASDFRVSMNSIEEAIRYETTLRRAA